MVCDTSVRDIIDGGEDEIEDEIMDIYDDDMDIDDDDAIDNNSGVPEQARDDGDEIEADVVRWRRELLRAGEADVVRWRRYELWRRELLRAGDPDEWAANEEERMERAYMERMNMYEIIGGDVDDDDDEYDGGDGDAVGGDEMVDFNHNIAWMGEGYEI
jgi:hypothetical protein